MIRIARSRRLALTLVDAVVGASMLGFVGVLVVPVLRTVDEEARIAVCLGNVRQLMTATSQYLDDYDDRFPVVVQQAGGAYGVCSWSYGGKTADDYWKDVSSGVFYIPAAERPINPYLLGAWVEPDQVHEGVVIARTEVPVLRCPSDHYSHQRSPYEDPPPFGSYDDVGTSYHVNLHAIEDTNIDVWAGDGAGWNLLAQRLVRDVQNGQSATFTWYVENPMDAALHDLTLRLGDHGTVATYTAGFLDGHAVNQFMDTTRWCGPGWEAINTNWVRQVGAPSPPIYYVPASKKCDP